MTVCSCGTPNEADWYVEAVQTLYPLKGIAEVWWNDTETEEFLAYYCDRHLPLESDFQVAFDSGHSNVEMTEWLQTFLRSDDDDDDMEDLSESCLSDWERN